jgi:hypothetical protein
VNWTHEYESGVWTIPEQHPIHLYQTTSLQNETNKYSSQFLQKTTCYLPQGLDTTLPALYSTRLIRSNFFQMTIHKTQTPILIIIYKRVNTDSNGQIDYRY